MEFDVQIRAARLRAVFERLPVTVAITVVNGAAVAAVLAAGGAGWPAWAWLALVAVLAAIRMALWAGFRRDAALSRAALWEAAAIGGAVASGLAWGIGAALLAPVGMAGIGPLVMLLLLGAMAAGAATVHAVHLPVALAFIVPAGVPLAAGLALQGEGRGLLLAAMVLLYVAVLVAVARHCGRHFDETFGLQVELDRAHATLRQAQRMEAIGQLTGGVAHDFNNVLAVIGGNLQLIARRAQGHPDILRLAASAERATERGARLTSSLLSFAREQVLRPEEVDLNEMVRECAPILRRMLGGRMELVLGLAPGRLVAKADPAQLQAALMQLAINARDASPPGRTLTIVTSLAAQAEAAPRADGSVHPGPFACVRVSDTGPGMSPEVAARPFEPFFTTREVGQGSGLGLSQVYGFARQSGGEARIEQEEGGGAAVCLLLPALAAQVVAEMPACAAMPGGAGRVLLVEDDADVREVLREGLVAGGWQVTQAADAAAACRVLEGPAPFDIVVSDMVMPGGMSGMDLASAAARLRPGVPVLLMSGFPSAVLGAQGVEEGELNLLRKPFTHAELLARMRRMLAMPQPDAELRRGLRASGG